MVFNIIKLLNVNSKTLTMQLFYNTIFFVFCKKIKQMKTVFMSFLVLSAPALFAQQKNITQAIITTKTTTVSAEGDGGPGGGANVQINIEGGGEGRSMRFGGDGEVKTTTTVKNSVIKTLTESEMAKTTVIRDNANKITTTLMEMMGNKNGFYITDSEQVVMAKRMDSMMQTRSSSSTPTPQSLEREGRRVVSTEIAYVDGARKVAGIDCKKAIIYETRKNGNTDSTEIWYAPDFKVQGVATTSGAGGGFTAFNFRGNNGVDNLQANLVNLKGFPMLYVIKQPRGRTVTVEVTKVVLDKEVNDKEFEIPKDFTLKPMSEMQNMGGGRGGFMMRMGGRN
jgi:hypothetical protein